MSIPTESPSEDGVELEEQLQQSAHHPSAPSDELFAISTTVDPSYIISLIRKLLPPTVNNSNNSRGINISSLDSKSERIEVNKDSPSENGALHYLFNELEAMDTAKNLSELDDPKMGMDGSNHQYRHQGGSSAEETWEEYGCILWDLAASTTHSVLMVQNLILEVLLATLAIPQSPRVSEISLGILGNLACHEVCRKQIISTNGLIEIIVDQLFLPDTPSLCETFRLLSLCLQGSEGITLAKVLQSEHILSHILWIVENTLNLQLMEKTLNLLLIISESQRDVSVVLLPPLFQLGLPKLLTNLLLFEMNKLTGEREPERYCILDLILRTIEALSVIDDHSQEICSNKELFQVLSDLIKLPDKIEVAGSCVTAAVLIANILTDAADLAFDLSHDLLFLQGLFEVFPFAFDDTEARSALWSIVARLLVRVKESEMSTLRLHHCVSVLASKADLIEEELLDGQLDDHNEEYETLAITGAKLIARSTALKRIFSILNQWITMKDHIKEGDFLEVNPVNEGLVNKLLDCCCKHAEI